MLKMMMSISVLSLIYMQESVQCAGSSCNCVIVMVVSSSRTYGDGKKIRFEGTYVSTYVTVIMIFFFEKSAEIIGLILP